MKKKLNIWYFYKFNKFFLFLLILIIIFDVFFTITSSMFLTNAFNVIIYNKDLNSFYFWIGLTGMLMVGSIIFSKIRNYFEQIFLEKISMQMKIHLRNKWNYFSNNKIYQTESSKWIHIYNNEVQTVIDEVYSLHLLFLRFFLMIIYSLAWIFYYFWGVGIYIILMTIIMMIFPRIFNKKMIKKGQKYQKDYDQYNVFLKNTLENYAIFRNHNKNRIFLKLIKNNAFGFYLAWISYLKFNYIIGFWSNFLSLIGQAGIFIIVGYVISNNLSNGKVGSIIPLIGISNSLFGFFTGIIQNISRLKGGKIIFDSFNLSSNLNFLNKNKFNHILSFQEIKLENISVSYKDKIILDNFHLKLSSKEKVLILGKSGSGKSTIINLIIKFNQNYSGNIYFNKINYKNLDDSFLRKNIFYSNNINNLINDNIYNNITMYDKSISKQKIMSTLKKVNMENITWDYNIDNDSSTLSEGQKQRIKIARSLINKRPIMIFDESFANIDKKNFEKILNILLEELKDSLVIIVSHHFPESKYKIFDKVIDLNIK